MAENSKMSPTVAIVEQVACVEREVRMRRRVYPRWVQDGRMTQGNADREIAAMEAVLATLKAIPGSGTQNELRL